MTPRSCACTDFTRSHLVRRAVAEAGRGLPAVEPGMPLPAGTGLSRRSFLSRTAGLALAVYGADRVLSAAFEEGIAAAAAAAPNGPVLVSVFLDGGADSMSALFPAGDARYQALRPRLALPASAGTAFTEDSRLRWHPSLAPLAALHAEGKVTVLPAIGYTSPDQSHFTSRHYWEVGATSSHLRTGWLGRYLDVAGTSDNPLQGISLNDRLQPALATAKNPIASFDGPDRYTLTSYGVSGAVQKRMLDAMGAMGIAHRSAKDPAIRQVADVVSQVHVLRNRLAPFVGPDGRPTFQSPVAYPTSNDPFPRRLAGLAAMLAAGLPLRCVSLRAPGMYDTHNDQADNLTQGLKLTADSLLAFQRDLETRGLASRVVVHLWSEFGRRGQENGSLGTDHGAAGIGFLIGSRVRGTMVGEFPGLTSGLDRQGNLVATSDFRGVYAAILEQWFGQDATAVTPDAKAFSRPVLFR
jgi:uncharacterized protein (DUF1501 family)